MRRLFVLHGLDHPMTDGQPDSPVPTAVPPPRECVERDNTGPVAGSEASGAVVWHREALRIRDHPAVTAATNDADIVLPLFVFDPGFYGDSGLSCDARVRFLHECLFDLDDRYDTASAGNAGLTYAHGDPIPVLDAFGNAGWTVFASRTPTGRYGLERDRAAADLGVRFVSGDGLRRGVERTRDGWSDHVEAWFEDDQYEPSLGGTVLASTDTGVTVEDVETWYGTDPEKSRVPDGGTTVAREKLETFVGRLEEYPGNISSPLDAREGCSGLSPYIRFGCLSTRQVYQYVQEHADSGRGREMFTSRLFWNRHYNQKLEDWPGWLDTAVNPELEGFNRDTHDPDLVAAWKEGRTGYPMVDAAMRCLRETGWLNFRMRAMAASAYFHLLQQPWQVGADWYHHHLIDSDAAINYTQWQSQAGLVGKPTLRLYNPRKQVRDQDPEGEWIRRWVPELEGLPPKHLPQPEKTPPNVQAECGVSVGEGPDADYPRPVVEYEAAKERFWRRYGDVKADAAARLADEEVAKRASLSKGVAGARAIADEYGKDPEFGTQTDLTAF
jgi:deoxyribodipyrimidine photo-lyase